MATGKYVKIIYSVGFGDYFPKTHVGRLITVISALWGNFLVSLSVVALNNDKKFSFRESQV